MPTPVGHLPLPLTHVIAVHIRRVLQVPTGPGRSYGGGRLWVGRGRGCLPPGEREYVIPWELWTRIKMSTASASSTNVAVTTNTTLPGSYLVSVHLCNRNAEARTLLTNPPSALLKHYPFGHPHVSVPVCRGTSGRRITSVHTPVVSKQRGPRLQSRLNTFDNDVRIPVVVEASVVGNLTTWVSKELSQVDLIVSALRSVDDNELIPASSSSMVRTRYLLPH